MIHCCRVVVIAGGLPIDRGQTVVVVEARGNGAVVRRPKRKRLAFLP